MSKALEGKNILLISPQAWHKVRVSKHHYATVLAERGNKVFFLNPPGSSQGFAITHSGLSNLDIVDYSPFFPLSIRFRSSQLFDLLMKWQVKLLLRKLKVSFDIVWCFDPNLYTDLSVFSAPVKIFHPVDLFDQKSAYITASTAQVIFSVSPSILEKFSSLGVPSFLINHGLGKEFVSVAQDQTSAESRQRKKIGYVGNLQIPYLDRDLLRKVIYACPEVDFHFIGPYESGQSSLGNGDKEARSFIKYLQASSNVVLMGPMGTEELAGYMKQLDAFLICYSSNIQGYDLSNTHKMLEYLSTGKPVISTPIKAYVDHGDIISMPLRLEERSYPEFFINGIKNISGMMSAEKIRMRKTLALANTYYQQTERIAAILTDLKLSY